MNSLGDILEFQACLTISIKNGFYYPILMFDSANSPVPQDKFKFL